MLHSKSRYSFVILTYMTTIQEKSSRIRNLLRDDDDDEDEVLNDKSEYKCICYCVLELLVGSLVIRSTELCGFTT